MLHAGFCAALARHHGSEDATAFPLLARQAPELAPVLAQLQADHQVIASILRRIDELASGAGPANAAAVRGELDGLAAILESHFRWEERRVTGALNALDPPLTRPRSYSARCRPAARRPPGSCLIGAVGAAWSKSSRAGGAS